ncbi:XkdX family protein [Fictibacillus gelatini]|nr:XkdX family protein [Fictibacillus gelatini]
MNFWELAYKYNWATKDQLKEAVFYNDLTIEDFERITGEPYVE